MDTFTALYINKLKPKATRYTVRERNGFAIRVSPSGKKSWLYIYDFEERRRFMTLGSLPLVSLAEARKRHTVARSEVEAGIDAAEKKQAQKRDILAAPTVAQLAEEFLAKHAKVNTKPATYDSYKRMLEVYVLPKIGKRKAAQVTKREIIFVIEDVAERGPTQANRVLAVTRKMFNFAVEKDILSFSPCYGVKQVAKEKAKDRNLSAKEIKAFWDNLETAKMSEPIKCALRLILITAQRPGEVLSIEAKEVDEGWWTISGEKAKNATPHRVPLSPIALETLPEAYSGHLFTSPRGKGKHIHVNALAHAIRRNKEHFGIDHFTPHDLRRTAATQMRQIGVDRFTVSRILNHVDREITATYDRYSHDKEKRQALEKWGRKLGRITARDEGAKVIHLSN